MKILVVDDLRRFDKDRITATDITYARSSSDALILLEKNKKTGFSQVWLDHDLGEDDDIRPVVKWIEEHQPKIGQVFVQSMNPVGVDWIVSGLRDKYKVTVTHNPYLKVPDDT